MKINILLAVAFLVNTSGAWAAPKVLASHDYPNRGCSAKTTDGVKYQFDFFNSEDLDPTNYDGKFVRVRKFASNRTVQTDIKLDTDFNVFSNDVHRRDLSGSGWSNLGHLNDAFFAKFNIRALVVGSEIPHGIGGEVTDNVVPGYAAGSIIYDGILFLSNESNFQEGVIADIMSGPSYKMYRDKNGHIFFDKTKGVLVRGLKTFYLDIPGTEAMLYSPNLTNLNKYLIIKLHCEDTRI